MMAGLSTDSDMPLYTVTQFMFHPEHTDSELILICNGKRFIIRLTADSFNESPQLRERYLYFLRVAEEFELDGLTVDDFQDWIVEPFHSILRDVEPLSKENVPTLHDFYFAETHPYTLRVVAEKLIPDSLLVDEVTREFGLRLPEELCSRWPRFLPSDIGIYAERPEEALSDVPQRVRILGDTNSSIFFLKPAAVGDGGFVKQELRTYAKIADAQLEADLRVPRLHGLVRDENGLVYGFLLTYIHCQASNLACAAGSPRTSLNLKQKWATQVKATVERLHASGITWGDVKPNNVLIDEKEDAWVVDFGGGYTEGWVSKELTGTVAGDLEGLGKILESLEVIPQETIDGGEIH
ncbi:hypothetical protein F4777DRAFT_69087 [Nemania sp. FL0916]|nr:hypothetical protein F4777DRAFT_69087 [Nemania sp. FL0916]